MTAPSRCHDCGHKRQRVVSATRQTQGAVASLAQPVVRKKPCDCACHRTVGSPA